MLAVAFIELPRMDVFVTLCATHRGGGKLDAFEVRRAVGSPVAVQAGYCRVRTLKREIRTRVVELQQVRPRGDLMAIGAFKCFACRQSIGELITMRMLVALSAAKIGEVKFSLGGNRFVGPRLMARLARDRDVRSHQLEAALLMSTEGKSGWAKAVKVVAIFALPSARGFRKLAFVGVGVAIRAGAEWDFIERLLTLRLVALFAFHVGVLADKRVV